MKIIMVLRVKISSPPPSIWFPTLAPPPSPQLSNSCPHVPSIWFATLFPPPGPKVFDSLLLPPPTQYLIPYSCHPLTPKYLIPYSCPQSIWFPTLIPPLKHKYLIPYSDPNMAPKYLIPYSCPSPDPQVFDSLLLPPHSPLSIWFPTPALTRINPYITRPVRHPKQFPLACTMNTVNKTYFDIF